VEQEQHALRRALLDVLEGRRRIPVGLFEDKFPDITLNAEEVAGDLPPAPEARKLVEPKKLNG